MTEKFHFAPSDQPNDASPGELSNSLDIRWSVIGGKYHDPDPNVVAYINQRYPEPATNTEAILIKAFELAELLKPVMEMIGPLEHIGLLPTKGKTKELPHYRPGTSQTSELTDRIDEKLVIEFSADDDIRNFVQQKIIEMIEKRQAYNSEQEKELWRSRRAYVARHDMPPVLRIITVMVGINPPEKNQNQILSKVPEGTRDLAPDIYWMMFRDEKDALDQTQSVA